MEDNLNTEDLIPIAKNKQLDLTRAILAEDDIDKLKDLTHLFNAHQTKRQVARLNVLNDVQDALVEQMLNRLSKVPDNFDNADLASWLKVVQSAVDASQKNISQIDATPTITYQQNNQININTADTFDKESRDRILKALQAITQGSGEIIDLDESSIVYNDESVDSNNIDNINSEDSDA